jgi:hypothetical protein
MLTRVSLAHPAPGRDGRHRTRTTVRSANRFSLMKVADAVAVAGHEVHVCRYREARTLLRWLGDDLRGLRVLDVAAGDGYWAGQARRRGAWAVALDLAEPKLRRGRQLAAPPALIPPGRSCDRAGPEVLVGDSAQGVGFMIDGTSTKACRAVRLTRALLCRPARVTQERSRCGRGTSRTS